MAIYVITGRPRHGKTYYMSYLCSKFLKQGRRIYSNLKLNLGVGALKKYKCVCIGDFHLEECIIGNLRNKKDLDNPKKLIFYWNHLHQWEHMTNGVILCDEMARYFNARHWANLSEETEIKLQQHGKEDLDVWGTVQHYTRIDASLRLLVERWLIVKTIWGNPDNKKPFLGLKRFNIVEIDLEDIEDYEKSLKFPDMNMVLENVDNYGLWFRKKYAIIYNTRQPVGPSESMPLIHRVRICNYPGCNKEEIKHT